MKHDWRRTEKEAPGCSVDAFEYRCAACHLTGIRRKLPPGPCAKRLEVAEVRAGVLERAVHDADRLRHTLRESLAGADGLDTHVVYDHLAVLADLARVLRILHADAVAVLGGDGVGT